jgi:hypothetical protein
VAGLADVRIWRESPSVVSPLSNPLHSGVAGSFLSGAACIACHFRATAFCDKVPDMRFVRSIVMPRPADWFIRLVHAGMACAIIVAGVVALHGFEISKECHGAFDRGFSNGFDRYSCYLKIRIENGTEFRLPVSG